ncbi:hypothetical protein L6452_19241 [Arctium lappa]|uniref:Uncharacterized protein n=1 Tax=Arctium lappa TaxID=4217 RepID=A0ACB9B8X0_ARCLA|nr:hypothetical protein L6452_19241 [Arctium lappa]
MEEEEADDEGSIKRYVAHFEDRYLLWSTIMERKKMEMIDAFMKRKVELLVHMEKQEERLQKIMRDNVVKNAG